MKSLRTAQQLASSASTSSAPALARQLTAQAVEAMAAALESELGKIKSQLADLHRLLQARLL